MFSLRFVRFVCMYKWCLSVCPSVCPSVCRIIRDLSFPICLETDERMHALMNERRECGSLDALLFAISSFFNTRVISVVFKHSVTEQLLSNGAEFFFFYYLLRLGTETLFIRHLLSGRGEVKTFLQDISIIWIQTPPVRPVKQKLWSLGGWVGW